MPFILEGRCTVAVDIHLVPYDGRRDCTGKLITSKARQGTDRFHGYSTIYVAVRNRWKRRITFLRAKRMPFTMPVRACRKMAACWNSRDAFTHDS
jgi:hypothetical protein